MKLLDCSLKLKTDLINMRVYNYWYMYLCLKQIDSESMSGNQNIGMTLSLKKAYEGQFKTVLINQYNVYIIDNFVNTCIM